MNTPTARFGIGSLSERTRCNIETIRYYEREGLMPHPPRTQGGHRMYNDEHLKRLVFIRRSRELGFTLQEVRELLSMVDGGNYTCEEVRTITLSHLADIRKKLVDLRKLSRVLKSMADQCSGGSVPECPIISALFESR